jgi:hypothetical protein
MPPGGGIGPVIILPPWLQAALEQPVVYGAGPGYRAVVRARQTQPA